MAKLSRYFTPPLSLADKKELLSLFGLAQQEMCFIESTSDQFLFQEDWQEGQMSTACLVLNRGRVAESLPSAEKRTILMEHSEGGTSPRARTQGKAPFEQLFSHPFSLLFASGVGREARLRVSFLPHYFAEEIAVLQRSIHKLEDEMAEAELSCLWVKRGEIRLALLFHFVRKKLIRVGTSPELQELGISYDEGRLNSPQLRQYFGTNSSFFVLDLGASDPKSGSSFQVINQAIQATLNEPNRALRSVSPLLSALAPYPDLEL